MPKDVKDQVLERGWRCLMQPTRDAAVALAKAGKIYITQKGKTFVSRSNV